MNVIEIDYLQLDNTVFRGIGYGMLECTNQLNYKTSPSRQSEGSMENINNYESFVLPQLKVGFNFITHEDYDKLRSMLLSKRTFIVRYYDIDFNRFVYHEMVAHPDEVKNFFNLGNEVIGLQGFSLTFVGTLNGKDDVMPKKFGVGGVSPTKFEFNRAKGIQNIEVRFPNSTKPQYVGWGRSVQMPTSTLQYKVPSTSLINKTGNMVFNSGDRVNIYEDTEFSVYV